MRKVPKQDVVVLATWNQWSGQETAVWYFDNLDSAIAFVARSMELSTRSTYTVVEVRA